MEKCCNQKPQVIFVLGGPGSGKGTQCEKLVRDFKFCHLSTGDLFRAEIKGNTEIGQKVKDITSRGDMVPPQITVDLLLSAIKKNVGKYQKFLIDGFPRDVAQAIMLENALFEIDFILDYQCSQEELVKRILHRAKTSGRADDNEETLKNRIQTFIDNTKPTLELYGTFGKVYPIDASGGINEIFKATKRALLPNLIFIYGPPVDKKCCLAKFLECRLQHKLINMCEFFKENNLCKANDVKKTNFLINVLQNHPEHNFILNGFPSTKRQLSIFLNYFAQPKAVFYLEASKDYVEHNIKCNKMLKTAKCKKMAHCQFDNFLKEKEGILKVLKVQDKFINIKLNEDKCFFKQIVSCLKPEVIFALPGINPELMNKLIGNLVNERQYIHLDVQKIIKYAKERNTCMGKKYTENGKNCCVDLNIEQLKKILFFNPNNKKFVITNFSDRLEDYKRFETDVCPIDRVVTFSKPLESPFVNEYAKQLQTCGPKALDVFNRVDQDQNGTLDRKEMVKMFEDMFKMWAMEADYAADDFMDDYDIDGDGLISTGEWMEYTRKELEKRIRGQNVTIQKSMDAFRIPMSAEYSPTSHYYQEGRLGVMKSDCLKEFDCCFESSRKWGIILGSAGWEGQIAKYMASNGYGHVIDYEKFREAWRKKLSTEEEELEELTIPKMIECLGKELQNGDRNRDLIFDGWPFPQEDFDKFLAAMGAPAYILELNASKQTVIDRYCKKEQTEFTGEDPDEVEKVEGLWTNWQSFKTAITDHCKALGKSCKTHVLEVNLSNFRTQADVDNVYRKRVLLVRDFVNPCKTYSLLSSFASRYGVILVCPNSLIKSAAETPKFAKQIRNQLKMRSYEIPNDCCKYFPSNFTPELVMSVIKNYIGSLPQTSKDLILFNYPCADFRKQEGNENIYPRCADELLQVEQSLGPAQILLNFSKSCQDYLIDDKMEEKVVEEEVTKEVKEVDEDGEEQEEQQEQQEDENAKKDAFNPEEFEWTVSNGAPKNLCQLFFKKKNECVIQEDVRFFVYNIVNYFKKAHEEIKLDDVCCVVDKNLGQFLMELEQEIAQPTLNQYEVCC